MSLNLKKLKEILPKKICLDQEETILELILKKDSKYTKKKRRPWKEFIDKNKEKEKEGAF